MEKGDVSQGFQIADGETSHFTCHAEARACSGINLFRIVL